MKSRIFLWLLLVGFTAFCLLSVETKFQQQALAEKTVRLHVVANSDSGEDQAQKLRVRDAVLKQVSGLTAGCRDAKAARQAIGENLDKIQKAAQEQLLKENSPYSVEVSLGKEKFPTRYYDTFTLPAGTYPALRVKIGEAQGHNWWCVVFPSLCTAATADMVEEYAQVGGFDSQEAELITGGEEKYELRFKSFEWLQGFLSWIS